MGEIGHPQVREAGVGLVAAGRTAGPNCLLVEDLGDLGIDVIIEEPVDQFDHRLQGLDLLRRGFGVLGGQGLRPASLEADMDPCRSLDRELHKRDILDDVGEQPLALTVREARIGPKRLQSPTSWRRADHGSRCRERTGLPASTLSFLLSVGQCAQLVVPFALERIGDKAVGRIDEHESSLCEIGVDLGALDGATAEPIRLVMPRFDLSPDLQGQLDRGRRHLIGDQFADRLVDRRARDRLAARLAARAMRTVADVPGIQPAASSGVSNA